MCTHLMFENNQLEDPVIVFGCGRERAEETGCSASFGVRPWLGIGNEYYIEKVATFRNAAAQRKFADHLDAFITRAGVRKL